VAKAREIPGLSTELPYGEVAARVLEVRCDELVEHSANVLDTDDIERVHDMRVATRRLRAAIEIFRPCFPKGDGRRALREIKALADALGERRDRDVAIDALESFAAAMPAPDRPGIRSLADRFRDEQRVANEELAPFVDAARLEQLTESVRGLAAVARERAGEAEPEAAADGEGAGR
jgi:CHAD domain-containing protein